VRCRRTVIDRFTAAGRRDYAERGSFAEAMMRQALFGVLIAITLFGSGPPTRAETVDLQLILAADVSRSVDEDEFRLQRDGTAAALTNPRVIKAIQSGPYRSIAITFIEWSGAEAQHIVADWTVVRDDETAGVFAAILQSAPRSFAGFTSISAAIDFSMKQFANSGVDSERRTIDVSGDGTNNGGRPVNEARDEAVAAGVTINGLAIINQHPNPGYFAHTQPPGGLGEYYKTNVTGGPGSFVITIEDFDSFAEAMTNKLVNEIASAAGPRVLAARYGNPRTLD
jgi:hypothetical protein